MAVQLTIRNVSEEVRDQLASRAARRKQSMQQYLHGELERLAAEPPIPSIEEWLTRVSRRVYASDSTVTTSAILEARDADRR